MVKLVLVGGAMVTIADASHTNLATLTLECAANVYATYRRRWQQTTRWHAIFGESLCSEGSRWVMHNGLCMQIVRTMDDVVLWPPPVASPQDSYSNTCMHPIQITHKYLYVLVWSENGLCVQA